MPVPRTLVVYVDVDDTLVRNFGSKQIPMAHVVERVRVQNPVAWRELLVVHPNETGDTVAAGVRALPCITVPPSTLA